jgi:hypothetical protein
LYLSLIVKQIPTKDQFVKRAWIDLFQILFYFFVLVVFDLGRSTFPAS